MELLRVDSSLGWLAERASKLDADAIVCSYWECTRSHRCQWWPNVQCRPSQGTRYRCCCWIRQYGQLCCNRGLVVMRWHPMHSVTHTNKCTVSHTTVANNTHTQVCILFAHAHTKRWVCKTHTQICLFNLVSQCAITLYTHTVNWRCVIIVASQSS